MLEYDLKLNNFSYSRAVVIQKKESLQKQRFCITPKNKFRLETPICPKCNRRATHNGHYRNRTKLIKELGLEIKYGQYQCKCGCRWSTRCKEVDNFVEQHKSLIKISVFDLCRRGLSLDNIQDHILNTYSETISKEWTRQLFFEAASEIKQLNITKTSGIFHYDEQVNKINGKEAFRLTIVDAVSKKVILDKTFENAAKETITDVLKSALLPYNVLAFVTDMDLKYPEILKGLYPWCKHQWCIFHLNKLILKEFIDSCGKKIPLTQLYNMYSLFNLFFNHEKEIAFLKKQLKKFEKVNGNEYEKMLIKKFYEYRSSLKRGRRRKNGIKLQKRTKEETLRLLEKIEKESFLYPKKLKKRIKRIRENLDKFTVFQENSLVPPTNNNAEHYFSATLQKAAKKRFRSEKFLTARLDLFKAKANGFASLQVDFFAFLLLAGKIVMLFG